MTPGISRTVRTGTAFDWVLVVLLCALTGVVSVFGIFFLPTYAGSFPLPAVVVVIALILVVVPRTAYGLTGSMPAAAAPVLVWLIVTGWFGLTRNSLYPKFPLATADWRFMLLVGVGSLSAAGSIGLLWGDHLRRRAVGEGR